MLLSSLFELALAWESSFVSSWILRSAVARSSVGEAVMTTRASHATCPYSARLLAPASRIGRTRYGGTMECPVGAQRAALPLVSTAGAIGPAGRRRRRPLLKHRNSRCDHYGSVGHGSSAGRIHRML